MKPFIIDKNVRLGREIETHPELLADAVERVKRLLAAEVEAQGAVPVGGPVILIRVEQAVQT